jgi:small subunit ribosomal protein S15
MLKKSEKKKTIATFKTTENDTGSSVVQIALLTKQIKKLADHLKKNEKDNHSRRGLLQMISKRRGHMKYLKKKDAEGYETAMKELELK